MSLNRIVLLPPLSALVISLSGCIGGSTPMSQFYLLEPIHATDNAPSPAEAKLLIALAPVRIPKYADRPQIVSATAQNTYQLSELNRWAEALDENMTRVLMENLSLLVPAEMQLTNTSNLAKQAKYRIAVNILEFYVDPKGQAKLNAQWDVTQDGKKLSSQQMSYQSPASTFNYQVMVTALNKCLSNLTRDIATSLRQLDDAEKSQSTSPKAALPS
ncbi:MAG: PqiC family protein [Methylovulum sp.]|nr:PqiC family protein [Methylovulum sp.]